VSFHLKIVKLSGLDL